MKKVAVITIFVLLLINSGFAQNQQAIDSITKVLQSQKDDTNKVNTLYALAFRYKRIDPQKTLEYEWQLFTLSRKLHYQKGIGYGYLLAGIAYELKGNYKTAVDSLLMAEQIFRELQDQYNLSTAYSNLSHTYGQAGDMENAANYGLKDLQLKEARGDSIGIIDNLLNLCRVYSSTNKTDEALKKATEALELSRKIHNKMGESMSLNSLGNVYNASENYAMALKYYLQTLDMRKELGDSVGMLRTMNNIGSIYAQQNNLPQALTYLRKAKDLAQAASMESEIGQAYGNMGIAFMNFKDFDSAIYYFQKSLVIARKSSDLESAVQGLVALSNIYEAKGDYVKALDYYKMHSDAYDSLLNEDHDQAIAELQAKYEANKKDQQITLLNTQEQLKNEQLSRQQLALYGTIGTAVLLLLITIIIITNIQRKRKLDAQIARLEQKNEIESVRNKISLDIHDDIGSGLTKINLLLSQFNLRTGKNSDPEQQELVSKISAKSREVISGLGEIVWTANPEHDNLKSLLGFMRQYISRFFEDSGIHYTIDFPNEPPNQKIHPELKRNLFLVLKESLNNVMKHSGATEVHIRYHLRGEKFSMEITDNGKGMDEKPLTTFGNGLKSMKKRIEEVKGSFNFNSSPGKGTDVLLEGMLY